jgi:hypothetical protein
MSFAQLTNRLVSGEAVIPARFKWVRGRTSAASIGTPQALIKSSVLGPNMKTNQLAKFCQLV